MRFDFVCDPTVPMGAWCLQARAGSDVVRVRHGRAVEMLEHGFVCGAWAGDFADTQYVDAPVRMGTGAAIHDDELKLLPPSHPYEAIVVARRGNQLLASNSMVFLLTEASAAPLVRECRYYFRMNAAFCAPERIYSIKFDGATMKFLLRDRFAVTPDLSIRREPIAHQMQFDDFASYRERIIEVLGRLASNGTSAHRRRPLSLNATISGGYDSAAGAALASEAGWCRAVTFVRGPGDPDDGSSTGEHLGYRVEPCPADAWKAVRPLPEAEFLAASGPATRVRLAGAEQWLGGALLLNGNCGDVVWDRDLGNLCPGLTRPGMYVPASTSVIEWSLRVGTTQVPVPAIGADDPEQLRRLVHAPEMAPWTLGTSYDRPIPRRLLEERGVPRESFGVNKAGGAYVSAPHGMTDASRADLAAWHADHRQPVRRVQRHTSWYASRAAVRVVRGIARRSQVSQVFSERQRLSQPSWERGHLFHWGVERTRPRYGEPSFD